MSLGKRSSRMASGTEIGENCPICFSALHARSEAIIVPCRHAYCVGCIRRWSDIKRKCPLCNSDFSYWLCRDGAGYRKEVVSHIGRSQTVGSPSPRRDEALGRRRDQFFYHRRIIRRLRGNSVLRTQRSALPRLRSFQRSGDESPAIVAERTKRWRASIYQQRLRAVLLTSTEILPQMLVQGNTWKETILKRIEPWIKRELEALLGDPDPAIIVHVVTSHFMRVYEKLEKSQDQIAIEDGDFLAPLRPFLHWNTEAFWHELICYSKSPFSMEAYDASVVYERVE